MAIAKEDILEAVGSMSVLELNELVKAFEEKFGVSAAAVAVAGPAGGGAAGEANHRQHHLVRLRRAHFGVVRLAGGEGERGEQDQGDRGFHAPSLASPRTGADGLPRPCRIQPPQRRPLRGG